MEYVGIIFEGKDDSIYLQLRDNNTDVYPNYWNLFGGAIEKGESPVIAAIREVKEETGIELQESDLELMLVTKVDGSNTYHAFRADFKYDINVVAEYINRCGEGAGIRKFGMEQSLALENIVPELKNRLTGYWAWRNSKKSGVAA